jgi:hypothetical protein
MQLIWQRIYSGDEDEQATRHMEINTIVRRRMQEQNEREHEERLQREELEWKQAQIASLKQEIQGATQSLAAPVQASVNDVLSGIELTPYQSPLSRLQRIHQMVANTGLELDEELINKLMILPDRRGRVTEERRRRLEQLAAEEV